MATTSDSQLATVLAEMSEPLLTAISPIKSPVKRSQTSSDDDIPSSQPAPKRPRTNMSFNTLQNKIALLQTRQAKAKKSSCVLKEHIDKSSCPLSLQCRPRPHLRTDRSSNDAVKQITTKAEQDLLATRTEHLL